MNRKQSELLKNALRQWVICFIVVAGFLFYHSRAPLGPILIAGVITLGVFVARAWWQSNKSPAALD